VTIEDSGPTDPPATNMTGRFDLGRPFLCYDNKQQIQVTIRMQKYTESWPAEQAFLLLVVPVETLGLERRSAGNIKTRPQEDLKRILRMCSRRTQERRYARWGIKLLLNAGPTRFT
jgi:hypothetical protein